MRLPFPESVGCQLDAYPGRLAQFSLFALYPVSFSLDFGACSRSPWYKASRSCISYQKLAACFWVIQCAMCSNIAAELRQDGLRSSWSCTVRLYTVQPAASCRQLQVCLKHTKRQIAWLCKRLEALMTSFASSSASKNLLQNQASLDAVQRVRLRFKTMDATSLRLALSIALSVRLWQCYVSSQHISVSAGTRFTFAKSAEIDIHQVAILAGTKKTYNTI